ncbi:MAG: translesion error-prone DNA polymerase V autoproteolytic subunit [Candidatus Paceibacterota bacterium]
MKAKSTTLLGKTKQGKKTAVPLFASHVQAGFPSSAEDSIENSLDLNRFILKNPATTFFVRAEGNSMEGAGIFSGDILVVDRSLTARKGNIVIAIVFDELTVKRLCIKGGEYFLIAENEEYEPLRITEEMESSIWGVVTHSLRTF